MIRSFYIAGTAMLTQADKLDVLSHNLTNADTTGYKKDKLLSRSFSDMLIDRINDTNYVPNTAIGNLNTGIHTDEIITDFTQGSMEQTARLSDIALEGTGFFVIETPQGNRYTRDGGFYVNQQGYLTTADGYYVSGVNGRINVGNGNFVVDTQGNILVDGQITNRLELVTFNDLAALRRQGDNLFSTTQAPQAPQGLTVRQGYLESSNVNAAEEMVNMLQMSRAFGLNQRVLTMIDQSLEKTVNQVGRV